jgi:hypothetical protein
MWAHPETRIWFFGSTLLMTVVGAITMSGLKEYLVFFAFSVPVVLVTTWAAHKNYGPPKHQLDEDERRHRDS